MWRIRPWRAMPRRGVSRVMRFALLALTVVASLRAFAWTQGTARSWLDEPKLSSWNAVGAQIPAAPKIQGGDTRCRDSARSAELPEDKRLQDRGWLLAGAYQGGWRMLVIRGTAGYDGMCRPRQYQDFVFVSGTFAGTLAPRPMDSRTDGAIGRVHLQGRGELVAEYLRYAATDPLCCPSRTTSVVFQIPAVRPASRSTAPANRAP